jgi:transposase
MTRQIAASRLQSTSSAHFWPFDKCPQALAETPDMTLAEIADHLEKAHGLQVAQSTVWRLLDRHDQTFKKNRARKRTATA